MRIFDYTNSPIAITALLSIPAICVPVQSTFSEDNIAQINTEDILKFADPIKIDHTIDINKKINSLFS